MLDVKNVQVDYYDTDGCRAFDLVFFCTINGTECLVSMTHEASFAFTYSVETWDDPGDYPSGAGGSRLPSYDYPVCDDISSEYFEIDNIKSYPADEDVILSDEDKAQLLKILEKQGLIWFDRISDEIAQKIYREDLRG